MRPDWLPQLNLRSVTRESDRICTQIAVETESRTYHDWIVCGLLTDVDTRPHNRRTYIGARLDNVVDDEHGSCYAFYFEGAAVEFEGVSGGLLEISGIFAPGIESSCSIHAPRENVTFESFPSHYCERCEKPHGMADFTPDPDPQLWKHLRGRRFRILVSPYIPEGLRETG